MKVEFSNIAASLDAMLPGNGELLAAEVSAACGCELRLADDMPAYALDADELAPGTFRVAKRSVDARKKTDVHFVVTAVADLASTDAASPAKGVRAKPFEAPAPLRVPDLSSAVGAPAFLRPVVVGAGPAGLFCAFHLAEAGLRPLVVERGRPVEERLRDVEAFASGGPLDAESNVQFGEGGAGAFSDGKLNTGTKSPHVRHVLEAFVCAGAPRDILVDAKPHIGTDLLPTVVRNLRTRIEAAGGEFAFSTKLAGVEEAASERDATVQVRLENVRTGEASRLETCALVVATGHSARDTLAMLHEAGIAMMRKPFAVGVRIEHAQTDVDAAQYGPAAGHPALGPADYKLVAHNGDGRGVYTFCMCPGGTVVAAASEAGGVCVNGMSDNARSGRNANSALLVGVDPEDLPGEDVLEGVRLQRRMERAAFDAGRAGAHADFAAPVQTVGDFLAHASGSVSRTVQPSYPRKVAWCDVRACLPGFVAQAIEEALPQLGRKLRGFDDPEAVVCGVEARSSCPVKIVREDDGMQSVSAAAIYPAGEGAGYAGGIMSAAVDGLRVAEAVCLRYSLMASAFPVSMKAVNLRP